MNIVAPYAKLLSPVNFGFPFTREDGINLLRRIEYFGRFSHASEEDQTEDSWERFIKAVVMGHGDWSIVEHARQRRSGGDLNERLIHQLLDQSGQATEDQF